ncbi:MAG TPA: LacI family DNA-binding transcriptional regulator [Actinomycetales bacterium]|nr:LacI family DNA-binding transcriptional regulator [Actinomycetales bacterium]
MLDGRSRRVTSADVARAAGLSRATVSYVLNDTPGQKIPQATRQRVLDAAAQLGYAPSAAARALRSGRSDIVLCLLPDWPIGATVGAFLEHLSAALAAEGLTFVAHPRARVSRPVSEVWRTITPAAVLAFEEFEDDEARAMRAAGTEVSVALLGGSRRRPGEFGIPQQRVGRLQAEHLAAKAHRRLGFAAPDDPRVRAFAEPRLDGVRHACAELGLPEPDVRTVPLDPAGAAEAVRSWRALDPVVTGVCAYNDDVALAVLAGLRVCGLRAPDDLAVVGVDDVPTAALADPPLTTVTTDMRVVAESVAQGIVRALAGEPAPRRPGSDIVQLVVRESA